MAISTFLLLLLALLLPTSVKAQQRNITNIILLGSSLSPITTTTTNSSWLSPSGRFAFGFYPQSDDAFVIAVWFAKIPERTVVWYFTYKNDDNQNQAVVVSTSATLMLNKEGALILRKYGRGKDNDDMYIGGGATSASMLESGNFVLYDSRSQMVWQTFDSPTNTIVQGQRLASKVELFSASIEARNLKGKFRLKMQEDGNLVQYPIKTSDTASYAYWASGTGDKGPNVTLNLDNGGNLYLLNGTSAIIRNITDGWNFPTDETIHFYRVTLDSDGIFRVYSHTADQNGNWSVRWSSSNNRCDPKGLCGLNAYCTVMDQAVDCRCIPQFEFTNQADSTSDCVRKITYACENRTKNGDATSSSMVPIEGTSWRLDEPYFTLSSTTEDECKNACLEDCNCEVVRFDANTCRKHGLPLMYGKRDGDTTVTFIKMINNNDQNNKTVEETNTFTQKREANGAKKPRRKEVIAIGAAFLSSSLVVLVISGVLLYKNYTNPTYKKILMSSGLTHEISLRSFEYSELEQATNGFKEEVGRGSFGTVFKGVLPYNNQVIAVKRLDKNLADEALENEFQTEMRVIGKTHHKNLVKLLGYCQSGSNHRLLVYEYMSKGSLTSFLFNSDDQQSRPNWDERLHIAINVARGILYLHEECETQIIHCDIKLQNILMDENGCTKIGNFGLAKLLKPDQTKTFTEIRGTRGYVAPEWHRNVPVTVKVDMYSFGIVLLEIVCCRRNLEMDRSEDERVLADWAYECFNNGKLG